MPPMWHDPHPDFPTSLAWPEADAEGICRHTMRHQLWGKMLTSCILRQAGIHLEQSSALLQTTTASLRRDRHRISRFFARIPENRPSRASMATRTTCPGPSPESSVLMPDSRVSVLAARTSLVHPSLSLRRFSYLACCAYDRPYPTHRNGTIRQRTVHVDNWSL